MAKTIKSALADTLENLSKGDFERFCHQLLDRREEPRVKRNRVEGKSRLQITDVLVSTFTEERALTVVLEILKAIGCNQLAKELEDATGGNFSKPDPGDRARHPQQQFSMDIERTHEPLPTPPPNESDYYTLTHNPRGWCVVFNNEIFTGGLNNRKGTQEDADTLKEVFTRLGFQVKIHNNCTAEQMEKKINDLGKNNFKSDDGLVVFVLSHGEKGCVFGTDGGKVFLKELTDPFTSGRAPTLTGKPKLFFIQACQGDGYQKGYRPCSREDENRKKEAWQADASIPDETVPELADFLIGMSTVEECKSFRNKRTGSIYIQELCKQLKIAAESQVMDDILTVLTRVNREISKGEFLSYKQMPEPKYTLTKKLVLKYI
ncbi:caspase-8 isoform X2 [Maylandia zebra]|uniref:caspase-8 isoform X2 n=1 Tax=Maylandia zebra TaxID=106582 RepID=UPI00403D3B2D